MAEAEKDQFEDEETEEDAPLERRNKIFSKESLIQNHFHCTCSFWYEDLSKLLKKKLQITGNKMVHFILDLNKWTKITVSELQNIVRCMMYGFGDDRNPYTESVDILEDLVIDYISEMTKKAMEVGRPGRISVEDIIFLIRKDPKKYSRVKELLMMSEELRKARKAFDEIKYATATK